VAARRALCLGRVRGGAGARGRKGEREKGRGGDGERGCNPLCTNFLLIFYPYRLQPITLQSNTLQPNTLQPNTLQPITYYPLTDTRVYFQCQNNWMKYCLLPYLLMFRDPTVRKSSFVKQTQGPIFSLHLRADRLLRF